LFVGELSALGSAVLWAVTSLIYKTQAGRVSATALNALRCLIAAVFFALVVVVTGRTGSFAIVPTKTYGALTASVLVGIALGDTAYFRSMNLVGVSRALPISGSFPLFTLVFALLFLHEPLTMIAVIGACLVVGGVCLVAMPRGDTPTAKEPVGANHRLGVAMAILAALCWAASASVLSWGMGDVDLLIANATRLTIASFILSLSAFRQGQGLGIPGLGRRGLGLVAIAAVFGSGFSGMLFLGGVQYAGAAVATTLSSTAPLFAAPLSRIFLGEQLTRQVALGTVLSFTGIVLIVIRGL